MIKSDTSAQHIDIITKNNLLWYDKKRLTVFVDYEIKKACCRCNAELLFYHSSYCLNSKTVSGLKTNALTGFNGCFQCSFTIVYGAYSIAPRRKNDSY